MKPTQEEMQERFEEIVLKADKCADTATLAELSAYNGMLQALNWAMYGSEMNDYVQQKRINYTNK